MLIHGILSKIDKQIKIFNKEIGRNFCVLVNNQQNTKWEALAMIQFANNNNKTESTKVFFVFHL